MAREITGAREWYCVIDSVFPDKELLSKTDACRVTGFCYNTLMKHFPELKGCKFISKNDLSKLLAKRSLNLSA